MVILRCTECSATFKPHPTRYRCGRCGGLLEYVYDYGRLAERKLPPAFTFWRYRPWLPEVKRVVSMGEGGTPLHRAERLAERVGLSHLYIKDETRNPTNSFRDRCAALMVSNAQDLGYRAIVCATNGNLGASLAAYCARVGLPCHIVVPRFIDMGKLAQMLIYDADIEEYGELVDEAIQRAERLAGETGWYQATAELNPLSIEAQKTIAFEVAEQMDVPDWIFISMGSGGTLYSVWKGFRELLAMGRIDELPRLVGVQAQGCPSIVDAYLKGRAEPILVEKPYTHALAILVRNPLYGRLALRAIAESKGEAISVSDSEILIAEQEIARLEGIFAEPASSATLAALKRMVKDGTIDRGDQVVCLVTGSGLKATDVLQALAKRRKTAILGLELSTKEKILRILSEEDTYGYDLWKKLGRTMTKAAVYQHLNELHTKGLVAAYERDGRKYFRITDRGERVLHAIQEIKALL